MSSSFFKKRLSPIKPGDPIDYKDVDLLKKFITERGKILPRRLTGLTAKQQRDLTNAVKRARIVALLPFVNDLLELMPLQASIQVVYSLVLVQIGVFDLLTLLHGWRRPRLLVEPPPNQRRWHLLLELALEPAVCLLSLGVALCLSPVWWDWTFLMLLPGYGLLWWLDR